MASAPWVSILTPIFNGIEFFEECARSVVAQEDDGWEWWVGINGHGPTGGEAFQQARAILDRCQTPATAGRIHLVNLPDAKGKEAAMNAMVTMTMPTVPWIAVLDCDDLWHPAKLALQRAYVTAMPDLGVLGTQYSYITTMRIPSPSVPSGVLPPDLLWSRNAIGNSSAILRREYAHWLSHFYGLDDYDLWIRLMKRGVKMANLPQTLMYHRLHPTSSFNASKKQDVPGLLVFHRAHPEVI